jgi:plastocyanin
MNGGPAGDAPTEEPLSGDVSESADASASASGKGTRRERHASSHSSSPDVSPMDFWRSGRPRSHRERQVSTAKGPQGVFARVRNMYLPPWVPVAGIIFVVFGILALLFVTRSATGAPRIGKDHWHATYTFYACGEKQPNAPTWESGVHTHGDGVVHIHPFRSSEEGPGARLVKWFDYGSGKLTHTEIRMPGSSKTWKNGDECPDGSKGELQVFVNSKKLSDWSRYLPKDGDRIRLDFGAPQDLVQLEDRIVIPEEQATRTIEMTVTGDESGTKFDPASIQAKAGEKVKIHLTNTAAVSHGLRFAGSDGEYDTGDDFVVVPVGSDPEKADKGDVIEPGGEGFTVVQFDAAGTLEFKDPTANDPATGDPFATGTVIVSESASATPAAEQVDQEFDVLMKDNVFEPAEITLAAGKKFRLKLTNEGKFAHNIRIAGKDGEFETEDDISSVDVFPGTAEELIGQIDEPGEYEIRDDFHPGEMTGKIILE